MAAKTAPAPAVEPAMKFQEIDIKSIVPSPHNPRKTFRQIEQLADSIRQKGIIEPIVVRPIGKKFELVAGERRFRAAAVAKIQQLPAMIRDYSDLQAAEAMTIENDQRDDVHPLEQADGYQHLISLGSDPKSIAEKTGRPLEFIAKRLQLLKIIPAARALFAADKIPLSYALELARLPASAQERLTLSLRQSIGNQYNPHLPPPADFRRMIARDAMRPLNKAAWKMDDAKLDAKAGPCATCLKNTANSRALFDDVDPKSPTCTDAECYERKSTAFVKLSISATRAEKKVEPVLLSSSYASDAASKKFGQRVHGQYDFQIVSKVAAKKLKPDEVKPAVIVDGDEAGKTVLISVKKGRDDGDDYARRDRERQAREAKKKRIEKAQGRALAAAIIAESGIKVEGSLIRALLPVIFERQVNEAKQAFAKNHNFTKPKGSAAYGDWKETQFNKLVESAKPSELPGLLLEVSIGSAVAWYPGFYDGRQRKALFAVAESLGLKPAKIISDAARAEVKASKPAKAKK